MNNLLSIPRSKIPHVESVLASGLATVFDPIARDTGVTFNLALLQDLESRVLTKHAGKDVSAIDRWFAPRLHFALRLSRRRASDPGVWTWLATGPLKRYMERRWPKSTKDTKNPWWHYTGRDLLRNGISRLWWGAEMTRSGPDYSLVENAFSAVRTFQFVSELRYSWHREAARSFTRAVTDTPASDDDIKGLSKLLNVYLKTRALERWDASEEGDEVSGPDGAWLAVKPTLAESAAPIAELVGPAAGVSRRLVEEELYGWLVKLFADVRRP